MSRDRLESMNQFLKEIAENPKNFKATIQNAKKVVGTQGIVSLYQETVKQDPLLGSEVLNELIAEAKINPEMIGLLANYENSILDRQSFKNFCSEIIQTHWYLIPNIPAPMLDFELCSKAMESNSMAFSMIPADGTALSETEYHKLAIRAVKLDGHLLRVVPENKRNYELCSAAIGENAFAIQYVPESNEKFIELVQQAMNKDLSILRHNRVAQHLNAKNWEVLLNINPDGFQYIPTPDDSNSTLTKEEYTSLAVDAIHKKWPLFNAMPKSEQTYQVCKTAMVASSGEIFSSILDYKKPESLLSKEEYLTFAVAMVAQNKKNINKIPRNLLAEIGANLVEANPASLKSLVPTGEHFPQQDYVSLCVTALENNLINWKYIRPSYKSDVFKSLMQPEFSEQEKFNQMDDTQKANLIDYSLWSTKIAEHPQLIEFFIMLENKGILTKDGYFNLCINAMKSNPHLLKLFDEKFKTELIEAIGLQEILKKSFSSYKYFPSQYSEEINKILKETKHIFISRFGEYKGCDEEIHDAYFLYADKHKDNGETIFLNHIDTPAILEKLKNNPELSLVLSTHHNYSLRTMAGFDSEGICALLEENPNLKKVILMGCNSADAKLMTKDQETIDVYKKSQQGDSSKCGFIGAIKAPLDKQTATTILAKGFQSAYVLIEEKPKESYRIAYINKDNLQDSSFKGIPIDADQLKKFQALLNRNRPFKTLKDNFAPKELNSCQKKSVEEISQCMDTKFRKSNPQYKQQKTLYPFLKGVKVNSDSPEVSKLLPSMLTELVSTFRKHPKIQQAVEFKGYVRAVHVDPKDRGLLIANTHLYKTPYEQSFFGKNAAQMEDIIARDKLEGEYKKFVKKMDEGVGEDDHTFAKSITVSFPQK